MSPFQTSQQVGGFLLKSPPHFQFWQNGFLFCYGIVPFVDSILGAKDKHDSNPSKRHLDHHVEKSLNFHSLLDDQSISKKKLYHDDTFIKIEDPSLVKIILENYADTDKRRILEKTSVAPRTQMEMLRISKLPQTTAYRKIISLIQQGLLIPDGLTFSHGRRVVKYKSVFERVGIDIFKNNVTVTVQLCPK
jgi:hypothetical protein